ncbi:hypothetical protein FOZ61_002972, partial [Perkinsus olseni]
ILTEMSVKVANKSVDRIATTVGGGGESAKTGIQRTTINAKELRRGNSVSGGISLILEQSEAVRESMDGFAVALLEVVELVIDAVVRVGLAILTFCPGSSFTNHKGEILHPHATRHAGCLNRLAETGLGRLVERTKEKKPSLTVGQISLDDLLIETVERVWRREKGPPIHQGGLEVGVEKAAHPGFGSRRCVFGAELLVQVGECQVLKIFDRAKVEELEKRPGFSTMCHD